MLSDQLNNWTYKILGLDVKNSDSERKSIWISGKPNITDKPQTNQITVAEFPYIFTKTLQVHCNRTAPRLQEKVVSPDFITKISHSVLRSDMTLNISDTNMISIFYSQNVSGIMLYINFCPKPSLILQTFLIYKI